MSFASDLAKAKEVENKVGEIFGATPTNGFCEEYDLKIEVKKDIMAAITGNVAFEYSYKGKPSGIMNGSEMIIYEVAGKLWKCRTEELIERLHNNKDKVKKVKGGDGNHSELALIKIYFFLQIFEPI